MNTSRLSSLVLPKVFIRWEVLTGGQPHTGLMRYDIMQSGKVVQMFLGNALP